MGMKFGDLPVGTKFRLVGTELLYEITDDHTHPTGGHHLQVGRGENLVQIKFTEFQRGTGEIRAARFSYSWHYADDEVGGPRGNDDPNREVKQVIYLNLPGNPVIEDGGIP